MENKNYRENVAGIILNKEGKILICEHAWLDGVWQIPQGGIEKNEDEDVAILRELEEELGTSNFKIIKKMDERLKYVLPPKIREKFKSGAYGQIQRYYLLYFFGDDNEIRFDNQKKPEFKDFKWVEFIEPVKNVTYFKKIVYFKALNFFKKDIENFDYKKFK